LYRLTDGGTPETKPRLIVVLSRRELNGGRTVIAAPTTTMKLHERIGRKQYVVLDRGESGATEKCVIQCDQITLYDFSEINTKKAWDLTLEKQAQVDDAIRFVFAVQQDSCS
jgi:mRNA-degrading endonuclease toxin of MazEF toxin-antitoxin module